MDGNSNSSGNHPGIIDFKDKSYVFGFNYARSKALDPNTARERRSVCLAELKYNTDGSIQKVPFWGSGMPSGAGVAQVGTLDPYVQVEAETMAWSQGLATEPCGEGGMDVTSIHNGDFIKIKGADFGAGATSFDARVASAASGGSIELRLDSAKGKLVGTVAVAGTGGWQTWTTKSCPVSGAAGIHDLFLVFTGTGTAQLFNFNWWKFQGSVSIAPQAMAGIPHPEFRVETSQGIVVIRADARYDQVDLLSPSGERRQWGPGTLQRIDLRGAKRGVYLVRVKFGSSTQVRKVFVDS